MKLLLFYRIKQQQIFIHVYLQGKDTFQCIYNYQAIMNMISLEHNPSLVVRAKNSDSPKQEEDFEFDYRQYRYLLYIFADNLNHSMKLHRDCLGDMEYHPKFRISKQQQQGYESSLYDIFQKYSSKLLKESVYRNTPIRKTCELYLGQYEKVFPINTETETKAVKKLVPSMSLLRKINTAETTKKKSLLSARNQNRKTASTSCPQQKLLLLSQTFKAFQADCSMTLKLITISSENPESKECFLRATRSTISKNERLRMKSDQFPIRKNSRVVQRSESDGVQQTCFKGNQILISEHRKLSEKQWDYEKQAPFHSKFCTKRVVAIGQSQKKTINDLEMLHMQTKNIGISGIFRQPASDLNQRPKFKRWQHSFS